VSAFPVKAYEFWHHDVGLQQLDRKFLSISLTMLSIILFFTEVLHKEKLSRNKKIRE
jgi:hypothetical protein